MTNGGGANGSNGAIVRATERFGAVIKSTVTLAKVVARADSFQNLLTGFGTSLDKLTAGHFWPDAPLDEVTLESLYDGNDLAARIVDAVIDDALRQPYEINVEPDDEDTVGGEETTREAQETGSDVRAFLEDELEATERLSEAWSWGRLFGAGALYVVVDDGGRDLEEPLDLEAVRRVVALTVLDRRDLVIQQLYADPTHPQFGRPELYSIAGTGVVGPGGFALLQARIHESRLIVFEGAKTSLRKRQQNSGWSLSVLQRPHDVIRNFETGWGAVAHVLQDAAQGVFKMQGLHGMIVGDQEEAVRQRLALVDRQRSVQRPVAIDKEDDFQRHAPALSGYPETLEKMMLRLAAAARMPVSVLMGQSPAGMNATGESDRLLWAQTVEAEQHRVLRPRLRRLAEIVMASREGPTRGFVPERWALSFAPLIHMTEEQVAAIRKTVAETDAIYIQAGIVLPEEVAISRFRGGEWSMETTIDVADREAMLEADRAGGELDEDLDPAADPVDPTDPNLEADPAVPDAPSPELEKPLAGGQIQQATELLAKVKSGAIPKDAARELLVAGLKFAPEVAARILAAFPDRFDPDAEPPTPPGMPGGPPQGPPQPPQAGDENDLEEGGDEETPEGDTPPTAPPGAPEDDDDEDP